MHKLKTNLIHKAPYCRNSYVPCQDFEIRQLELRVTASPARDVQGGWYVFLQAALACHSVSVKW